MLMYFSVLGGSGYYGGCRCGACGQNGGIIAGSVIGGVFGLMLLVIGIVCCCSYCKARSFRNNSTFVNLPVSKQRNYKPYDISAFQSGIWSSRYFQYGKWHGPYQFSLSFDPQSEKVTGSGSDDVGTFTVDGIYSAETGRLGLTKSYQSGTGHRLENLGHQVTIQLTWNAQNNQFEGKWYVQTNKYYGEDKFELKFDENNSKTIYEKV